MANQTEIRCSECNNTFYTEHGYRTHYGRQHDDRTPAEKEAERKHRYKVSERGRHLGAANVRKRYASSKESDPLYVRAQNLRKWNLTLEDYDALLRAQDYRCAGCRITEAEYLAETGKRFAVDHDHTCCDGVRSCGNCIRGLLCASCNNALGRVKDNPQTLRSLAEYLEAHRG